MITRAGCLLFRRRGARTLLTAAWAAVLAVAVGSPDVGAFTGGYDGLSGTEVPFFVRISGRAPGYRPWMCSGSLTTPRTVVTAAHCLNGGNGEAEPLKDAEFTVTWGWPGKTVQSQEAYDPYMVSPPSRGNYDSVADIGRLFLPAPFADARPLPVARTGEMTDVVDKKVWMYGAGQTEGGPAKAVNRLAAHTRRRTFAPIVTYEAVRDKPSAHACHGDSGGPVVLMAGTKAELAGVIIKGRDDNCAAQPTTDYTVVGAVGKPKFRKLLLEQPRG